ncbi:NmrA/HSCARG family protein [Pyxidicoccus fallax]|uniref:NmrA/HSCARG family protein n=1 Tax=Pyxidicoccus fallax TaxID=394095 RepID=A0A848L7C6_9BACT|nr:NmrA/HSCARG family protein [Pyxidicoccus fallax]NMO14669.1 NmrA/HSCARG family protein [Pyxidicoccus fallax]NPC78460.1 NmrA/HSCARG family protein [Pyxidicoccus fallax]
MSVQREVLVVGATGQQGGAVARCLLERGHRVRTLVRAPEAPAATELHRLGVVLVEGRLEDAPSLVRAMAGVEAVFGVTTPFEGVAAEAPKGMALVDAAREAGVAHFVFTSACNADRNTGIPSFESKRRVEEHLARSGVPYTIVAPAYFLENLLTPFCLSNLRVGSFVRWMPVERTVQYIAVRDIGRFVTLVLEQREPFLGRRIDLAGDELDGAIAADILTRELGHAIHPVALPLSSFPAQGELGQNVAATLAWMDRVGFSADIDALRREFPDVGWHSFAMWAQEHREALGCASGGRPAATRPG